MHLRGSPDDGRARDISIIIIIIVILSILCIMLGTIIIIIIMIISIVNMMVVTIKCCSHIISSVSVGSMRRSRRADRPETSLVVAINTFRLNAIEWDGMQPGGVRRRCAQITTRAAPDGSTRRGPASGAGRLP